MKMTTNLQSNVGVYILFQISMLEIYNDNLNDLLSKSADAALDIRVQGKSVSVPGLTKIQVRTEADILSAMETGEKNRKIASTKMNTQRCCTTTDAGGDFSDEAQKSH